MLLNDLVETLLSLLELARGERCLSEAEHQLRKKFFGREEPLDAMTLLAVRIEDENRRCPLRAVALAELLERLALFSSVHANWNEVPFDEFHDARVGIHLGIQPSTAASHRRGAEIQQHVALSGACTFERAFKIVFPCYRATLHSHLLTSRFPSPLRRLFPIVPLSFS